MKLQFAGLVTLFCISLALLGCGGGGGGGNPVAPPPDPNFDLKLQEDYPTIAASYVKLDSVLKESSQTAEQRVSSFMAEISADFVNAAGSAARTDLETTTLSRVKRYTINEYSFVPTAHKVNEDGTIAVTTAMSIYVVRKEGAAGGFESLKTTLDPSPTLTWKNESGTWKIIKGLPYLSTDVGGI
ncbi:MAG TPA: hypothetical protein PKM56_01025 [Candidatus Rifleibacterium sp.]|nr:hypothetical protein [Candidatus Rifleibacterium sp.]